MAGAVLMLNSTAARAQDPPRTSWIGRWASRWPASNCSVEGQPETSPSLLNLIDIKPGDTFTLEA